MKLNISDPSATWLATLLHREIETRARAASMALERGDQTMAETHRRHVNEAT